MKLAGCGDHTFNTGLREAETGMDGCELKAALVPKARSSQQSYIYWDLGVFLFKKKKEEEESHTFLLEDNNQFRSREQIHWINHIDSLPRW